MCVSHLKNTQTSREEVLAGECQRLKQAIKGNKKGRINSNQSTIYPHFPTQMLERKDVEI